jgi:acyl carrier protein
MTTFERIKMVVSEKCNFNVDLSEITEEAYLNRDLGLDSLDVVELAMEVEREFDLIVSDIEVESWLTVEDILKTVETKLK